MSFINKALLGAHKLPGRARPPIKLPGFPKNIGDVQRLPLRPGRPAPIDPGMVAKVLGGLRPTGGFHETYPGPSDPRRSGGMVPDGGMPMPDFNPQQTYHPVQHQMPSMPSFVPHDMPQPPGFYSGGGMAMGGSQDHPAFNPMLAGILQMLMQRFQGQGNGPF